MDIDTRTIASKVQFLSFIEALRADLETSPETFENLTLSGFLEALAAWTTDSDGYYRNIGEEGPPAIVWRYFADMLAGARVYE